MAARTFTASTMGGDAGTGPIKGIHAGLNVVVSKIRVPIASSLTASDVLLMARIPNGALITDWYCRGGIAASTTHIISVGFQAATGAAAAGGPPIVVDKLNRGTPSLTSDSIAAIISLTTSAVGGFARTQSSVSQKLPIKVSISGDWAQQWAWMQATCGGSTTGSHSLIFVVSYLLGDSSA